MSAALARRLLVAAGALLLAAPAAAWYLGGHRRTAIDAVRALPDSVPPFFRRGAAVVGDAAIDPDVHKAPETPRLRDREAPDHYLYVELLGGRPLPELRSEYVRLMADLGRDPSRVGYLPYAVIESTERLTLAFAEHRRWPEDRAIRVKALLHAGQLAHYAADLCQPLHSTIHHDGRAREDGASPHTGLHQRVDALFDRVPFDRAAATAGLTVAAAPDPRATVLAALDASHRLVEAVYAREASFTPPTAEGAWETPVVELTAERYRASVGLVATLLLTAWEASREVALPAWLERRGAEAGAAGGASRPPTDAGSGEAPPMSRRRRAPGG